MPSRTRPVRGGTVRPAHHGGVRDLAPDIHRQRLVIEGVPAAPVDDAAIRDYLTQLSDTLGMTTLLAPVTHRSPTYGWAGWIHWETSGAHFYAWEQPRLFFSVDIYTCAAFDPARAVDLTRRCFAPRDLEAYGIGSVVAPPRADHPAP
ncbi:MAG: S-adenosylmethionine decarboxylase [Candidatus Nanopelagicales bacterium]